MNTSVERGGCKARTFTRYRERLISAETGRPTDNCYRLGVKLLERSVRIRLCSLDISEGIHLSAVAIADTCRVPQYTPRPDRQSIYMIEMTTCGVANEPQIDPGT